MPHGPNVRGWLAGNVRIMLEALGTFFAVRVVGWFETLPAFWAAYWDVNVERPMNEGLNVIIDKLVDRGLEESIADELREVVAEYPAPIDAVLITLIQWFISSKGLGDFLSAASALRSQSINADVRPSMIGMDALGRFVMQNPEFYEQVRDLFDKLGIPDEQQTMYLSGLRTLPGLVSLWTLTNREHMTEFDAVGYLVRQGYSDDDAYEVMKLREFYPSPTDIVTLAGREAFEEDAISQFKLDQDMPDKMFEAARKAGISDEVLRWYWVAHWQNPSLNQVFEMIHRGVEKEPGVKFDLNDLDVYYRLADVNPYFGDMLRQIAYRPYTRVDIRRMYGVGVLDREGVKTAYTELGYDEEHAENVTEFVVRQESITERDLTKTHVDKLYQLGLIDGLDYMDYLEILGYSVEEAAWLKDLEDADLEEARIKARIAKVEYEFKRGMKDANEAGSSLSNLDIRGDAKDILISDWSDEQLVEEALPSKTDTIGWYESGLIDEVAFRAAMRRLRYSDDSIGLYILDTGARLSKTDVLRLYDREEIDRTRSEEALEELGYSERDINALLNVVTERIRQRESIRADQTGS